MSMRIVSIVYYVCLFFITPMTTYAGEWFVSPSGNDAAPGTKSQPFANITRAQEAVRKAKQSGDAGPHIVRLSAGTFELSEPLTFGPEDSGTTEKPVLYIGEGSQTVISGGMSLANWHDDGNGVWSVELPKIDGRTLYFEQLFVNGRRAVRSRYPNSGFFTPQEVRQGIPIDERNPRQTYTSQSIVAKDGDLDFFKDISEKEWKYAQFIVHHHWDTTRRIILGFNAEQNLLEMQGQPMKHWNPWRTNSRYYFENVRSGFDMPGEWFYDGVNGRALYRPLPNETLSKSTFVVPRNGVNQLLRIVGDANNNKPVHDIRFEKITFANTDSPRRDNVMRGANLSVEITGDLRFAGPGQINPEQAAFWADAAIDMTTADNVCFSDCEISNIGEYGLWLKNSQNCRIERCALTDLGAGGIRIGGNGKTNNNVVDNCIIQRGGRLYACAVAVWLGNHTENNSITHNDIGDFYYTGVSVGWTWGYNGGEVFNNKIEYNRIHDLGQGAMADMGGVYTLGTLHGTRVCNNVIFNVESYGYGGWGLYPDEGSEGLLMENNLVYDTNDGSFHQHYGKNNIIRNNILACSRPHQVAVTRVEPHRSLTFENNIIYWEQGTAIGYRSEATRVDWGTNLWWNANGSVDFKGKTHKEWLDMGKDVGGMVADPKFVDAPNRDFRLMDDSPAMKMGFVPFDFEKVGVYGDDQWVQRAKGQ